MFKIIQTNLVKEQLEVLKKDKGVEKRYKAIVKSIKLLARDPRHSSLCTHEYISLRGHNGENVFVSVYLRPGMHGQGLGAQLLRAGTNWVKQNFSDVKKIRAEILFLNFFSKRAFEKAGYKEVFSVYEQSLV